MSEPKNIKTNINVRLPGDIHLGVKVEAARRGMTLEQAYQEGMSAWMSKEDTGGGAITPHEGVAPPPFEMLEKPGSMKEYIQALKDLGNQILESQNRLQAQIHALTTELHPIPAKRKGKLGRAETQRTPLAAGRRLGTDSGT